MNKLEDDMIEKKMNRQLVDVDNRIKSINRILKRDIKRNILLAYNFILLSIVISLLDIIWTQSRTGYLTLGFALGIFVFMLITDFHNKKSVIFPW